MGSPRARSSNQNQKLVGSSAARGPRDAGPSLRLTFCRRARTALSVVAAIGVVLFALLSQRVVHRQGQSTALARARVYAAAIRPATNGQVIDAIEALRSRHGELLAVGTLDTAGRLEAVFPERAACRAAITRTLKAKRQPLATTIEAAGTHAAWGITLPLSGVEEPPARRAVFLLARESRIKEWSAGIIASALGMFGLAGLASHWLGRWVERRVARPLRDLGRSSHPHKSLAEWIDDLPDGEWRETRALHRRVRDLYRRMIESEARLREFERRSRAQLRASEIGFVRQLQRVKEKALIDALTGLRNRRYFETEVEQVVEQHRSAGRDLSVVMFDVDNFKQHNDTFGHEAGDEVLRFIGALLRGALRTHDAAIRYGGDEFMLLLVEVDSDRAVLIARRIATLFRQYAARFDTSTPPTLSAGVVSLSVCPNAAWKEVMARADAALYEAKNGGKNTVVTAHAA